MSIPPPGTYCLECNARGHKCPAQVYEGTIPVCIPCRDGDECAFARVAAKHPVATEEPDPCIVPRPSHMPSAEKQKCRQPDCAKLVGQRNASGVCADHWYWGKTHPRPKDDELRGERVIANQNASKAKQLEKDRMKRAKKKAATVAREIDGETVLMSPMAVMGAEMLTHRDPPKATITVTATHLDRFWSALDLETKASIFQRHIGEEA